MSRGAKVSDYCGHANFGVGQILSSLKRGVFTSRKYVFVVRTKLSLSILVFLYTKGLIESFSIFSNYQFKVFLRFRRGDSLIRNFKIISTPGRRVFRDVAQIKKLCYKRRLLVVSTNVGLLSGVECVYRSIGGELMFEIVL
jgi:small subunit ribosomal protein S8